MAAGPGEDRRPAGRPRAASMRRTAAAHSTRSRAAQRSAAALRASPAGPAVRSVARREAARSTTLQATMRSSADPRVHLPRVSCQPADRARPVVASCPLPFDPVSKHAPARRHHIIGGPCGPARPRARSATRTVERAGERALALPPLTPGTALRSPDRRLRSLRTTRGGTTKPRARPLSGRRSRWGRSAQCRQRPRREVTSHDVVRSRKDLATCARPFQVSGSGAPMACGSRNVPVVALERGKWSGRPDLNRRPPVPQTGALPDCATPRRASSLAPRAANPARRARPSIRAPTGR